MSYCKEAAYRFPHLVDGSNRGVKVSKTPPRMPEEDNPYPERSIEDQIRELEDYHYQMTGPNPPKIKDIPGLHEEYRREARKHFTG